MSRKIGKFITAQNMFNAMSYPHREKGAHPVGDTHTIKRVKMRLRMNMIIYINEMKIAENLTV